MIFKTITNEFGNTKLSINSGLKNFFSLNNDFFKKKSVLNNSDIYALKAYNSEIKRGASPATAYYRTLQNASVAAANIAKSAGDATVNLEQIPKISKAGQIALKGLSTAGNMLAMTTISIAISKLIEGIQYLTSANERYLEKQQEIIDKSEETISTAESKITALENLKEKLEDARYSQAKMNSLADELNDTLGSGTSKILKQSNAYEILNLQIEREIELQKKAAEEAEKKRSTAEFNTALNTEVENSGFGSDMTFDNIREFYTWNNKYEKEKWYKKGKWSTDYSKTVGEYADELIGQAIEKGEFSGTINEYAKIYREALEKVNNYGGYGVQGAKLSIPSEEELKNGFEDILDHVHSAFSDTVNDLNSFLTPTEINSIIDRLFMSGITDSKEITKSLQEIFSDTDVINDLWSEYLDKLTNDIDNDEDIVYNNLVSVFNKLKDSYPIISDILDAYFNNMIFKLEDKIIKSDKLITSFNDAFNASDFAEAKKELLELARTGKLSPEIISSTAEYSKLLKDTKLSAEACYLNIMNLLDGVESLSSAASAINNLNEAYTEFQDKGYVLSSTLFNIRDSILSDLDGYDLFESVIGNPTKTTEEIQSAFNEIVTEYIRSSDTLKGLYSMTNSEVQTVIENMEAMGISNAEEMVKALRALYKDDLLNYEKYNINKETIYGETWWNSFIENNKGWVDNLKKTYDIDLTNYGNYLNAKLDIQRKISEANDDIETAKSQYKQAKQQYDEKGYWSNGIGINLTNPVAIYGGMIASAENKISDLQDLLLNMDYEAIIGSKINFASYTGTPKSPSSSSPNKDTSQTYDWIETKIKRLNEALDSIKAKSDNVYSSWTKRNTELANAISKTKDAIELQSQAYTRYMQKADSVGLSENYKRLVQSGAVDISTVSDETLKDKISDYQTWYEKAQECLKTQEDLNSELNQLNTQKFDNIKSEYDAVINRMQSAYDLLENQITLLSSSGNYDTLRSKQADIVNKLQAQRNALQNNLNSSDIQQYTEQWYNLVSQLDNLDNQILDAEAALKNIDNLQFDNLKEAFDFDTSVLEHGLQTIQNKVDLLELKGQFANESYYNGMIEYTQKQLDTLKNERTQLQSILNNTLHKQGTAEWNDMYLTLMDIDKEIDSMANNLVDFNNTIRDLNWEIFEYLEESLNRITEETDYYVELMSKKHLFDENGQITNYGTASMALHAAAYDVYKQQAQDYYEEVQDLQKQLINGAGDEVLAQYNEMVKAHQDAVLAAEDEKQSILNLIEDGYNAQLDALQRLIDKKKEQLNAEKNLYDYQKSIAEKTDNISSLEKQKLAYEGDTSEEAMSKIQQIRVQLEEAKADLKESEYEQYLSDTETMLDQLAEDYENWMNERLDHSDELIAQIISQISSQGDTINTTLKETSEYYGTFISDSLSTIFSSDSPFTQSLTGGLNNVSNSLISGLGEVSTSVNGVSTSIAGTTTAITNLVSHVANLVNADESKTNAGSNIAANSNGNHNTGSLTNPYNPIINPAVNTPNTNTGSGNKNTNNPVSNSNPTNSSSISSSSNTSKTGKSLLDSILISKKDYYPKNSLNIDTSVVDRLKYYDKDSSFSARAMYWSKIFGGAYTGSPSQNTKLLNYLKSNGYKSGTSNAARGYHWTQEDGEEIIYRTADGAVLTPLSSGDMVFDNESSRRLWELSQNPEAYMKKYNIDPASITATIPKPTFNFSVPDFGSMANSQSSQVNVGDINVNLELPNVTDYSGFRNQLIKDNTFEKAVFTSINHALTGKGTPLDKLRHTR